MKKDLDGGLLVGLFIATAFTIDHYVIHGAKHAPLSHLSPNFWIGAVGGFLVGKYVIEPIITPYLR